MNHALRHFKEIHRLFDDSTNVHSEGLLLLPEFCLTIMQKKTPKLSSHAWIQCSFILKSGGKL